MCIFCVSLNIVHVIFCNATDSTLILLDSEGKYCGFKIEKSFPGAVFVSRLCCNPSGIECTSFNLGSTVART